MVIRAERIARYQHADPLERTLAGWSVHVFLSLLKEEHLCLPGGYSDHGLLCQHTRARAPAHEVGARVDLDDGPEYGVAVALIA